MPIARGSTYALVIISLGILGVIVSFLVTDKKKYYISLALSLFVVGMGLFEFVDSSFHQWRTSRRIAQLQESQRLSLETLQTKLREATEKARTAGPAPAPVAAPVQQQRPPAPPPAAANRKKK